MSINRYHVVPVDRCFPLQFHGKYGELLLLPWQVHGTCWGQNRSRRNQCLKVRKNRHEHFYEKQIFEKDLLLRRILQRKHIHEKSEKSPKKVARSLRSDRARAKLGRYVAIEHPFRSVAT